MHVVIVGGGFAGVYTAKHLLKNKNLKVTLLSKTNYFLFTPLLHEVAVGSVNRHNICAPIRDVLRHKNFRFIRGEADKIDLIKKEVHAEKIILNYDRLVIAAGCEINYFGVKGAEKFALGLKCIRDAIKIRDEVIKVLEDCAINPKPITFAVIGAGPTGVELCGDLCDLVEENIRLRYPELKDIKHEFYLVQAGEDILPMLTKKAREISAKILEKSQIKILRDTKVIEIGKGYFISNKGKIDADLIVWSGGIKPPKLNVQPRVQDENGYFAVDEMMKVERFEEVYALGDIAGKPWLAQSAVQQSKIVADEILGKKSKFAFHNKGLIVSLGHRKAVGEMYLGGKTFVIKGKLAWYLKRHIYLTNIIGLPNKIRVGIEWFLNLIFPRDISEI